MWKFVSGAWAVALASLLLFGALSWYAVSCTGQQALGGTDVVRTAAPLIPPPAGGLIQMGADSFDAAITAYIEQNPEKFEKELELDDWLAIAGMALFGGQARRSTTGLVTSLVKTAAKSSTPPKTS